MKPAFFITTMLIVSAALSAQRYSDQICGEVLQLDSATYYQTEQHGTYWATVTAPIKKINDRKSTRLNSSHLQKTRMPSSA